MQLLGDLTHPTNTSSGAVDDGGNGQSGRIWDHPFCQLEILTSVHNI